jgi:5-methylcytosine-specific restriction endonuclease McrA
MKVCNTCGESKALEAYPKRKDSKDGSANRCKECTKAYKEAYYAKNREKSNAKSRADYALNREKYKKIHAEWAANNADRITSHKKAYYAKNREKVITAAADWAAANPEKRSSVAAKWQKANPEAMSATVHRRRARKAANGVNAVSTQEWATIAAMPCTACAAPGPSEVDHIVPIARGGAHTIGNLIPLCRSCNASKNNMLWIEWKYSGRPQAQVAFEE